MHCHSMLAGLTATTLLVACSMPTKPSANPSAATVKLAAVLLPGCRLPPPAQFPQASSDRATLSLRVTPNGAVSSARIDRSSGSPSLDASLLAAAAHCGFSPAYAVNVTDHSRTNVDDDYALHVTWTRGRAPDALLRCFAPGYPHAARRAEEEGNVYVQFRLNAGTGQVDTQIRPDSAAGRVLRSLSLRAAEACLAHDEVRAALRPDQWMTALYTWRLD